MKYAMMTYTMARGDWGKDCNIEDLCRLTRELGLDAVDWVTTYNAQPVDIRKVMDDYGLKTVCHTFFADVNFPDKASRQQGLDTLKRGIEAASVLGTDKVMLPFPGKAGLSRDESRRNVIEGLKDVVEFAKAADIIMTIEHFPGATPPFVVSNDINIALSEIPGLKATFDSGNVLTGGENPSDGFLNNRDAIVHVHFKDFDRVSEDENGFLGLDGGCYKAALIGEGLVDYPNLLDTMTKADYNGYINIEYEGDKYSPEEGVRKALDYLRSFKQ